MKHALYGLLGLFAASFLASPAAAEDPSFDCVKAGNAIERLICADSELAERDARMARKYGAALETLSGTDLEKEKRAQKAWLGERNSSCGLSAADEAVPARLLGASRCLKAIYDKRIGDLDAIAPDPLKLSGEPSFGQNNGRPEACLEFDAEIAQDPETPAVSFFKSDPEVRLSAQVSWRSVCLSGFEPGKSYQLTILEGLAGEGRRILKDQTIRISAPDAEPSLRFATVGRTLARVGAGGLPVEGVNVKNVRARLMRVTDADALAALRSEWEGGPDVFSYGAPTYFTGRLDEVVWRGSLALEGDVNKTRRVALPIDKMAEKLTPGVYVAALEGQPAVLPKPAEGEDAAEPQPVGPVFYWFTVSDVGLTSYQGEDGLTVAARSISDGKPLEKLRLALRSAAGEEIGTAETDAQGVGRFAPGLLRGEGKARAVRLYAYGAAGDFAQLDLEKTPLDLSDRGVDGRSAPGALDAYVVTERGIYRPGEAVRLTVLLRDDKAVATPDMPLVLSFTRPDGIEARRLTLKNPKAGGYQAEFTLAPNAATGGWSVRALASDKEDAPAIGEASFTVEDFAPPRIEAKLTSDSKVVQPGEDAPLHLKADFLYGAPAGGMSGELVVTVRAPATPFPAYKDYTFGLADAKRPRPKQGSPVPFTLDAQGETDLTGFVEAPEALGVPLEASFAATVFDAGGKPAFTRLNLPLATQETHIGVKPSFKGAAPEKSEVGFEIVAVDASGAPIEAKGFAWRLVKENVDYIWQQRGDRWTTEIIRTDGPLVAEGTADFDGKTPAALKAKLEDWGSHRLEIALKKGEAPIGSLRFESGWWNANLGDSDPAPERLTVSVEAGAYKPGDKVKLRIEAPFPGPATVALADSRVHAVVNGDVGAEGGVIEVEFPKDSTAGVYALVSVLGKPDGLRRQAPSRAVGSVWIPADPAPRSLKASLAADETLRPNEPVAAKLTVEGAGDEAVYAVVAAVDDGVLNLTSYKTPDPSLWFLGQRRLGVDLRDMYGSFIEPAGLEIGQIKSGGDGMRDDDTAQLSNLPKKNRPIAVWVSPILEVKNGAADVSFTAPDFDGRLRLMALVWTAKRVGGAAEDMALVRRPLAADALIPRFLAPEDLAQATIALDNIDAPAGDYTATITVQGPISIEGESVVKATLKPGERAALPIPLRAAADAGDAKLTLAVAGPEGFKLTRDSELSVRPAAAYESRRSIVELKPGQSLKADASLVADYLPSTARMSLGVNPLPDLDIPGMIEGLARYPYGCVEQTTSSLMPLLAVDDLKERFDAASRFPKDAVAKGVSRLVSMQTYAGDFGMWSSSGPTNPWMTGYVMDTLLTARAQGQAVPESALKLGVESLKLLAANSGTANDNDLNARAYAFYLLAREGALDAPQLRRFHAVRFAHLTSPLAKAQIAAALAKAGDAAEARKAFAKASEAVPSLNPDPKKRDESYRWEDYGSSLRDLAGVTSLMADSGVVGWPEINAAAQRLSERVADRRWLSTQEQAWVLRAGRSMLKAPGVKLELSLDDKPLTNIAAGPYIQSAEGAAPKLPVMKNTGKTPVFGVVSSGGFPRVPPPAEAKGFAIARHVYTRDGEEADLAKLKQNDLVVVVLEGEMTKKARSRALVVDFLPAGLEPENSAVGGGSTNDIEWLSDLSEVDMAELRDDRFITALDLPAGESGKNYKFRVAYLARAVTPGVYAYGGAQVEDMYAPQDFARSEPATVAVVAPEN